MSTSCRRLVLPLWLPTRPTGNLRPATALYRHGLSRRQLALCRPHQRPGQIGETPSSRPTTESHLPLSIASRFQRDPHTLSLNVFTEYLRHVDVKCMLRRYLHLSVTDPQRPPGAQPEADLQLLLKQLKLEL